MNKKKIIIPVLACLLGGALIGCDNNEQPESNYYRIQLYNLSRDDMAGYELPHPVILNEKGALVEKGHDCDLQIKIPEYSGFNRIGERFGPVAEYYHLRVSNGLSDGYILPTDCYSVTQSKNDITIYNLHIPAQYMNCSYTLEFNLSYVRSNYYINYDMLSNGKLELMTTNDRLNGDLTYLLTPHNSMAGVSFNSSNIKDIQIVGYKNGKEPVIFKSGAEISKFELVSNRTNVQRINYYTDDTLSLAIGLNRDMIYEKDPHSDYGYSEKYDGIAILPKPDTEFKLDYSEVRYMGGDDLTKQGLFKINYDSEQMEMYEKHWLHENEFGDNHLWNDRYIDSSWNLVLDNANYNNDLLYVFKLAPKEGYTFAPTTEDIYMNAESYLPISKASFTSKNSSPTTKYFNNYSFDLSKYDGFLKPYYFNGILNREISSLEPELEFDPSDSSIDFFPVINPDAPDVYEIFGDIYPSMKSWISLDVEENGDLLVVINVSRLVRFTQFTPQRAMGLDVYDHLARIQSEGWQYGPSDYAQALYNEYYSGGSINFIDSINLSFEAIPQM